MIVNVFLFISNHSEQRIFSYKRAGVNINLPLKQSASCNFEKDVSVTYSSNHNSPKDKRIDFKLNSNSQPITISFINLDTDKPTMRGNGGQSNLVKLIDNDEVFTVIEASPILFGTLQSFTIFKETGVGIWTKQYNLGGEVPFGLVSMGYCD